MTMMNKTPAKEKRREENYFLEDALDVEDLLDVVEPAATVGAFSTALIVRSEARECSETRE